MATRGTYKVEGKLLYNHWDNYPEGAANHFKEVIKQHGNLTFVSLIKGGEGTGFAPTDSIFDGPAKFHYVITKDGNKTFIEINAIPFDADKIVYQEKVELSEFINKWVKEDPIIQTGYQYMTITKARELAQSKLGNAMAWLLRGHTGNASGELKEAAEMYRLLGDTKLIEGYNKLIAPMLAQCYGHGVVEPFIVK